MDCQHSALYTGQPNAGPKQKRALSLGQILLAGSTQQQPVDCTIQALSASHSSHQAADQMVKAKPSKHSRLLSSKSLSQLVPRSLFFRKQQNHPTTDKPAKESAGAAQNQVPHLATTKSFPTHFSRNLAAAEYPVEIKSRPRSKLAGLSLLASNSNKTSSAANFCAPPTNRHQQQSCSSTFRFCNNQNVTALPNLSPIVGRDTDAAQVLDMSWTDITESSAQEKAELEHEKTGASGSSADNTSDSSNSKKEEKKAGKYKPFKTTSLVLRDVKNSIGLRIKAKQQSKAFVKFTNEVATPPTKLYSPFDIITDTSSSKNSPPAAKQKSSHQSSTAKRKLNLKTKSLTKATESSDTSLMADTTPKGKVVMQHKKHLMQASKFNFDSPAGRHGQTVKDVEKFQQCIEDISKAIQKRGKSSV